MPINRNNSRLVSVAFLSAYVRHLSKKGEDREIFPKENEHLVRTVYALQKAHGNIKQKCENRNDPQYKNCGHRGIEFYKPWSSDRHVFTCDVIAEIGLKPDKYSLERPDNNRGYEPGNIEWATSRKQAANRRGTRLLILPGGGKVPLPTLAHANGIRPNSLSQRLDRQYIDDDRLRAFEDNWNKRLQQRYRRPPIQFTREQRHELAKAINRLPPEVDLVMVSNAAIVFWPQFADAVEIDAGQEHVASKPKLEFLLRNLETAVPFWQRQRAVRERRRARVQHEKAEEQAHAEVLTYEEWKESNDEYFDELEQMYLHPPLTN